MRKTRERANRVEMEAVITAPPRCADCGFPIEDARLQPNVFERRGSAQACRSTADDSDVNALHSERFSSREIASSPVFLD